MTDGPWKNRIIGYGESEPEQLLANEQNWRIHGREQQDALKGALDSIGWLQDIIVNKRTSPRWGTSQGVETVVDGHLRVTLAMRHGQQKVPVKYVDLEPEEEALALVTIDPISAMAGADPGIMNEVLKQVQTDDIAVQKMLAELAEGVGLYGNGEDSQYSRKIESPVYDPSGIKPSVKDLFDDTKTKMLIQDIMNADKLTEEERGFLIIAAQRHTVLSFNRIADFYAHSEPHIQKLMEDSALVILDFDRAIELGYVLLTKAIARQVGDEYGSD